MNRHSKASSLLCGLAPVVDARTRVLILGSFPGAASLAAQQYYAHPQNQFWRLLGALLSEPLPELDYRLRLERVLAHGLGIWDVLAACRRTGSLDSAITDARPNDFAGLLARYPELQLACFNGLKAASHAPRLAELGLRTHVLPSSSPANARLRPADKLALWRAALLPSAR